MTKETKRANFKRIATKRVNDIIRRIELLKNLKNSSFYDFERADLWKIIRALNEAVEDLQKYYMEEDTKARFKL